MSGIAWDDLMRFGLSDLRLPPDVFWALTPTELLLMAGSPSTPGTTRAGLEKLMAEFPDMHPGDAKED